MSYVVLMPVTTVTVSFCVKQSYYVPKTMLHSIPTHPLISFCSLLHNVSWIEEGMIDTSCLGLSTYQLVAPIIFTQLCIWAFIVTN